MEDTPLDAPGLGFNSFRALTPGQPEGTSNPLPNPCVDPDFHTPAYEFLDWNITKTYQNSTGEYPNTVQVAVTLRDNANNYSLHCVGEHVIRSKGPYEPRFTSCAPQGGFQDSSFQALVSFEIPQYQLGDETRHYTIGLQQYWLCNPGANSEYP